MSCEVITFLTRLFLHLARFERPQSSLRSLTPTCPPPPLSQRHEFLYSMYNGSVKQTLWQQVNGGSEGEEGGEQCIGLAQNSTSGTCIVAGLLLALHKSSLL
eukprot:4196881-Amphidinium_carterae.1